MRHRAGLSRRGLLYLLLLLFFLELFLLLCLHGKVVPHGAVANGGEGSGNEKKAHPDLLHDCPQPHDSGVMLPQLGEGAASQVT